MLQDCCPDWIRKALDDHFNEVSKLASQHNEIQLLPAYFGHIRPLIPETSGQRFGIIRTQELEVP